LNLLNERDPGREMRETFERLLDWVDGLGETEGVLGGVRRVVKGMRWEIKGLVRTRMKMSFLMRRIRQRMRNEG